MTGIKRGAPTSGPLAGPTRFHNHVIYGRTAYIAGQTAPDPSVQDYKAQTQQVCERTIHIHISALVWLPAVCKDERFEIRMRVLAGSAAA